MKLRDSTKSTSQHYFEYPQVQLVNGNKSISPVNDIADGVTSNIRTVSCQQPKNSIYSPRWPESVKYACSQYPTARESTEYVARNEVHGFGRWSIVARRWAHPMRFVHGHQWGMITQVHHVPIHAAQLPWFPYTVRWLANDGTEEFAWAEDLVVIHANIDDEMLLSIVEEQNVDVSEARKHIEERQNRVI